MHEGETSQGWSRSTHEGAKRPSVWHKFAQMRSCEILTNTFSENGCSVEPWTCMMLECNASAYSRQSSIIHPSYLLVLYRVMGVQSLSLKLRVQGREQTKGGANPSHVRTHRHAHTYGQSGSSNSLKHWTVRGKLEETPWRYEENMQTADTHSQR